jgi:hypothetical protein
MNNHLARRSLRNNPSQRGSGLDLGDLKDFDYPHPVLARIV